MRITGGVFRSRTLLAPRGQETRPTSDRVREALFSMLVSDGVFEADPPRVLDLYAGSGALGFEALSRGAASVVFVESARPAIEAIRKNIRALEVADRVTLVATRAERALDLVGGPFDLVLVDPPYAEVRTRDFDELLESIVRRMAQAGILVVEHASSDEPPAPPGVVLDRRRRHGDTTVSLFRRCEPSAAKEPSAATEPRDG